MAKMTLNELKHQIADILDEAKKSKKGKAKKDAKKSSSAKSSRMKMPQTEAYGFYDKEHDFSTPLGAYNLYRQQGAVNWGPYTSAGPEVATGMGGGSNANAFMKEGDEKALRHVVREVIENGLIDSNSAWSVFLEAKEPIFESSWEEVAYLVEKKAWFMQHQERGEEMPANQSKPKGQFDRSEYGKVHKKPSGS